MGDEFFCCYLLFVKLCANCVCLDFALPEKMRCFLFFTADTLCLLCFLPVQSFASLWLTFVLFHMYACIKG